MLTKLVRCSRVPSEASRGEEEAKRCEGKARSSSRLPPNLSVNPDSGQRRRALQRFTRMSTDESSTLPGGLRQDLVLIPLSSIIFGFVSGLLTSSRLASRQFLAENAHRLPTTVQGSVQFSPTLSRLVSNVPARRLTGSSVFLPLQMVLLPEDEELSRYVLWSRRWTENRRSSRPMDCDFRWPARGRRTRHPTFLPFLLLRLSNSMG